MCLHLEKLECLSTKQRFLKPHFYEDICKPTDSVLISKLRSPTLVTRAATEPQWRHAVMVPANGAVAWSHKAGSRSGHLAYEVSSI